jgi:hypothetical protein
MPYRGREIAFDDEPLVLFSETLDAIARIMGVAVGGRHELSDFIVANGCRSHRCSH